MSKKLLVIDDSSVDRLAIVSMLEKLGYQVDSSENANDLTQRIEKENYAAVILDIVMPTMWVAFKKRLLFPMWSEWPCVQTT